MAPSNTLLATLRAVSLEATDALVETLRKYNCIATARLVCKDLRQVIDGSVQSLKLTDPLETLDESTPPSLALWHRVDTLCFCIGSEGLQADDAPHITDNWVSWAGSQPPASLRKITSLRLYWAVLDMGPVLTASLVACIALWFPNLKVRFPPAHPGCYAPVRRSRIVMPSAVFST